MNILELISKLEVIYSQEGNIEVTIMEYSCGDYVPMVVGDVVVANPHGQPFVEIYGG